MQWTQKTNRLCYLYLNILSHFGKNNSQSMPRHSDALCVPASTTYAHVHFLTTLLPLAGLFHALCDISSGHQLLGCSEVCAILIHILANWAAGLSKLYSSVRLLCDVHPNECTQLWDQGHMAATQMRKKLMRRVLGSDDPFCTGQSSSTQRWGEPINSWYRIQALLLLVSVPTYTSFLDSHLVIHTNILTLSCHFLKKPTSACCFNHNILETAFQECYGVVWILKFYFSLWNYFILLLESQKYSIQTKDK